MSELIPIEGIENKIILIRGQKVLLDRDLAELYGVETRRLNEKVKRNQHRFPEDFMFQLTRKELENWMSQFATSNSVKMGIRKLPFVFTEQGVAMLSSILNSSQAIKVNIAIMRAFVIMRKMHISQTETNRRMEDFEERLGTQEFQTLLLIDQMSGIKKSFTEQKKGKQKIGFQNDKFS